MNSVAAKDGFTRAVEMNLSDCVDILTRQEHRANSTVPGEPTMWLAVFSE
ncbi:MAG: hypothetical protein ACYC4B_29700 [Pirellulaceae bacterium]